MNDQPNTHTVARESNVIYARFDELFERFRYPAGESHVALRNPASFVGENTALVIEASVSNFDDLCQVITSDRVLKRLGVAATWFVPYFPFARHDRRNHRGDGFELELALELAQQIDIVIADPHSDVAGQLPHIPQTSSVELFEKAGAFEGEPIVVVPDAGASRKTQCWVRGRSIVQALKHRDPATGELSSFEVLGSSELVGRPCIIVDDICDGGGTFLGLADQLQLQGAGPLTLAVTHGLFTKGTEHLLNRFEHIYSFAPLGPTVESPADVHRIPFKDLYEKGTVQ